MRSNLLRLKLMADPGLWFATNSLSFFFGKGDFSQYHYKPGQMCT